MFNRIFTMLFAAVAPWGFTWLFMYAINPIGTEVFVYLLSLNLVLSPILSMLSVWMGYELCKEEERNEY